MQTDDWLCSSLDLELVDGATHFENGEEERDDHKADQRSHDENQRWREQGDKRFGFGPHVALFDVGDLQQHFIEFPGLFANVDHLNDGVRKDIELAQWRSKRVTATRLLGHLRNNIREDEIADGVLDDLESR